MIIPMVGVNCKELFWVLMRS